MSTPVHSRSFKRKYTFSSCATTLATKCPQQHPQHQTTTATVRPDNRQSGVYEVKTFGCTTANNAFKKTRSILKGSIKRRTHGERNPLQQKAETVENDRRSAKFFSSSSWPSFARRKFARYSRFLIMGQTQHPAGVDCPEKNVVAPLERHFQRPFVLLV